MIVFPMSGLSSRFSKAGYLSNKYKLDLYGYSVFHHIISQFKKANLKDSFLFIHNGNDFDENFIRKICYNVGLNVDEYFIIKLVGETRGQAETVFKGLEKLNIDNNERLIIYNIDSIRIGFDLPKELDNLDVDGYLEVFQGEGDHWSFALPKNESSEESFLKVEVVAEKERISKYCSNGLYYFKSLKIFSEAYESEVKDFDGKNELFVAPLYNRIIENKKSVYMRRLSIKSTVFCGTPQEYEDIVSAPVPLGITPSEEYTVEKILAYMMEGISQKNYFKVMDILKSSSSLMDSDNIFKVLTVFFNYYGSYARTVEYSFLHFAKFGKDQSYQKVFIFLKKLILGLVKNNLNVQHNNQKSINLMAILLTIDDLDVLKRNLKEFKRVAPYITIPDHLKIFRRLRHKINDEDFLNLIFDKDRSDNSVSYLFLIFCLSYRIKDKDIYIHFIKKNLTDSNILRKGDSERKVLLSNLLLSSSKPVSFSLFGKNPLKHRKNIRVAVLITGQMRDYSTVSKYFNTLKTEGIDYDLYISTWDKLGQPPVHLNGLRGYEPEIRDIIRNCSNDFHISSEDFQKNYHLNENNILNENMLRSDFENLAWMNIDIEGETTEQFKNNQDRLYFKINQAFRAAEKKDYDAYIRVRPDLNFSIDSSTLANNIRECVSEDNLIYVRDVTLIDMYLPFIDDNFAISSPKAMKAYAELYEISAIGDDKLPLDPIKGDIRPHSSLGYQLLLNKTNIKFISGIKNWKYNDLGVITSSKYINYLVDLNKIELNQDYINSLISEIRGIK